MNECKRKLPVQKIPSYGYLFSWDEIPGNDNERLIEYLKKNFGIYWVKTENIEKFDDGKTITVSAEKNHLELLLNDESNTVNLIINEYLYLFNWEKIPGNDSVRLIKFLKKNYDVDWIKEALIDKIDGGKIIKMTTEKSFLSLSLKNDNNDVNLKIDDVRIDKFIAKKENSQLNIYLNDFKTDEFIVKTEASKLKIYRDRISQGDIYKDIEYIDSITEENGIIEIKKIIFPYVIILTQDCDLNQDFTFRSVESKNDDKLIISVLSAPIYNVEHLLKGEHLSQLGLTMQSIDKKSKKGKFTTNAKNLFDNNTPRYHYLDFELDANIVPSVIDFKHYFSINLNYLYKIRKTNFVCKIPELYREDISHRFASFLSRIGLPD